MSGPDPRINPEPTAEEAAAIAAALVLAWPSPPAVESAPPSPTSTRWRFSGRWWHHNHRRRPKR